MGRKGNKGGKIRSRWYETCVFAVGILLGGLGVDIAVERVKFGYFRGRERVFGSIHFYVGGIYLRLLAGN